MRKSWIALCVATVLFFSGCSGSGRESGAVPGPQPATALLAQAGLPDLSALPVGEASLRGASAADQTKAGSEFSSAGSSVVAGGNSAFFTAQEGQVGFALYQFQGVPDDRIEMLEVSSLGLSGGEYWLGVSDYARGSWRFYHGDEDFEQIDLGDRSNLSAGAIIHVAVIVFDGSLMELQSITLRFAPKLFPGWQHSWGSGLGDYPIGMHIDAAGNAYLVGDYGGDDGAGGEGAEPVCIVKYSPEGTLLASRTYFLNATDSGFGQPGLRASCVLGDAEGNLYIPCNYSYWPDDDGLNNNDFAMFKVDSNLNLQWISRYYRNESEGFGAAAFDGSGNVVLAGSFSTSPGGPGFTPSYARISPAGGLLEAKSLGAGGRLNGVSVDPASGDIFLSGTQDDGLAGLPMMFRISSGTVSWGKVWTAVSGQAAQGIAPDGAGGATLLVKESPITRYAGADQEPIFLTVDEEGDLDTVKVWASANARSVVQFMRVQDGVARICAPWRNLVSNLGGVLIYEFPLGDLNSLSGTLWTSEISVAADFATNGSDYAFYDNSYPDNDQVTVFPEEMQAGAFLDVTEGVVLNNVLTSVTDLGGSFDAENDFIVSDTAGVQDGAPDDDSMRITYAPGEE